MGITLALFAECIVQFAGYCAVGVGHRDIVEVATNNYRIGAMLDVVANGIDLMRAHATIIVESLSHIGKLAHASRICRLEELLIVDIITVGGIYRGGLQVDIEQAHGVVVNLQVGPDTFARTTETANRVRADDFVFA